MERGQMQGLAGPVIALTLAAALVGCADPRGQSNARLIEYTLISEEKTVDPATGDVVITANWQFADGVKTTTTKRIPRGNEERQWDRPPRPQPRAID